MQSVAIPLQQLKNVVLYFGNRNGIIPVMNNLLYAFKRESGSVFCVARNQNSIFNNKCFLAEHKKTSFSFVNSLYKLKEVLSNV